MNTPCKKSVGNNTNSGTPPLPAHTNVFCSNRLPSVLAASIAQTMPQRMGRGPIGLLTKQDEHSAADMGVTMNLAHANTKKKLGGKFQ